ncbi:unnamed protein product [Cunninghamella blakesleeana]
MGVLYRNMCVKNIDNRDDLLYSRGEIIEGCSQQRPNLLLYCNKKDSSDFTGIPCLWEDVAYSNNKQITCPDNQKCQCELDRAICK